MPPKYLTEGEIRAKHSEEVQKLEKELRERDSLLDKYREEHGVLEIFFRQIREAITPIKAEKIKYSAKKASRVESPCTVVMMVNDGHHGMCQDADEIEGFNQYDPQISYNRQMAYAEMLLNKVEMQRTAYKVPELVVLALGDLISGDIHEELRITNKWPSPVQAVEAGKLLAKQISKMAPHFERVRIEFVSEDNHARLTKKPQAKEAGLNSLNYVVGEIAKAYLRGHSNVEFNIYPMFEKVVHVQNRQYLCSHGHGIVGWMGVPWYSIERRVGKESTKRLHAVMQDANRMKQVGFHKYVFGHWHTPFDHPMYCCGGSVSGTDAFDHKQGRFSLPSQTAWFVHPKRGEFDRTNFMLS